MSILLVVYLLNVECQLNKNPDVLLETEWAVALTRCLADSLCILQEMVKR